MSKAYLVPIFVLSIFLAAGAKKSQLTHPMPGKFLVRTSENKSLEDSLSAYPLKIGNSYERIMLGRTTAAILDDTKETCDYISLGKIYRRSGKKLSSPISAGRFSVWLGKAPVALSFEKHLWQGRTCGTQWVCESSQMIQNMRVILQAGVDYQDRYYASVRIMESRKKLNELKKSYSNQLCVKFDNISSRSGQWKLRIRDPDGQIKEINSKTLEFKFPFDQKSKEFLIEARWVDQKEADDKILFRPVSGIGTFTKKWVVKTFPAWDCPEPWLNKLWYAQIYAINSQISVLPEVYDSGSIWLKDRRSKASKPPVCKLDSYDGFLKWCRSFFSKEDFDKIPDISIDSELKTNLPSGVIDMVVTKLVGLKAESENVFRIEPASWIGHWPYFAIDNLPYFDHNVTVVWQQESANLRYPKIEPGFSIFVDEKLALHVDKLKPVKIELIK